jgi:hypothetical protein
LVKGQPDDNMRDPGESFELAPVLARNRRGNDIARNGALASEKIVNIVLFFIGRDKLRYRLAMFRDQNGLSLSLNFIHHGKTMILKEPAAIFFIPKLLEHGHYTL